MSDLHLGASAAWQQVDDKKKESPEVEPRDHHHVLSQTLDKLLESKSAEQIEAVVVSGDLVHGKEPEKGFAAFADFIKPLSALVGDANVMVVPGNHDMPKNVRSGEARYDPFFNVTRQRGFATPLVDGIDFDTAGRSIKTHPQPPHLIEQERYLLIPINSSHFCWGLDPLENGIEEEIIDLLQSDRQREGAEKLLNHDIPRVSPAQMTALEAMLRERYADLTEPDRDDQRVRIAVIHHQLLPVSPREEFTTFESITNLGALRAFLAGLQIDVVLHGHKHEAALYWDYVADPRGIDHAPHRILVSAAPGDFKPRRPAMRLLHIGERAAAKEVTIEEIIAPGGPAASIGRQLSRARIWRDPDPDRVGDAMVVSDISRDQVYAKIQSLFEGRGKGNPIRDLICEITEPRDLLRLPDGYPEMPRIENRQHWMLDLVKWWQLKDPQLLAQVTFNHGSRIYRRFGNQVEKAAEALATSDGATTSTTRAIIILLDPLGDGGRRGDFPSFVSVHLQLIWDGPTPRLDCTGYFRKQEMRYWWPINVAELGCIREEVEGQLRLRDLVVEPGRLRTISAYAAVEERIPNVALAAIDRAIDQHPDDLWNMAHTLAHGKSTEYQDARRIWERYLVDLDPPEEPEPSIQVSHQGLRRIHEMLLWLHGERSDSARALDELASFYELLVEQHANSGAQAADGARRRLRALRDALDRDLKPRKRRRPRLLRFFGYE
ncbi:MAG TPA: metallophosphoesterase [Solirubrobacterales bacterium]|nr:metallophosphoesterase [Solirubrobacterales bacterium]